MSRIIKNETGSITRIELQSMDELHAPDSPVTAGQLKSIQEQAYQEAYQQGLQQGLEQGQARIDEAEQALLQQVDDLEKLFQFFHKPLDNLDQDVEQDITSLVITMIKQLFRREVKMDPGQIAGVVRDAIAMLPVNSRQIKLVMHPDDAKTIRYAYAKVDKSMEWEIVEDVSMTPGGCRVETPESRIDASIENRVAVLIAQVFGGEREDDAKTDA